MKTGVLGLILVLSCCGQQKKVSNDISELREKLPQLETPIEFNSDRTMKLRSMELPNNVLIKKLREQNYFTLVGKVFDTGDNITILGYIPHEAGILVGDIATHIMTPILITYDNNGNELSSHTIYENAMGDLGQYTINIATVLPDGQILFTDSTIILGTDSLFVTRKKYRLSDKGTIERVE